MLMPKSVTRSQTLGSSALKKDIVLPEQAPPWSQSRFAISPPADALDSLTRTSMFPIADQTTGHIEIPNENTLNKADGSSFAADKSARKPLVSFNNEVAKPLF